MTGVPPRFANARRESSCRKVWFALQVLKDEAAPVCWATNAELAKAAGVGVDTAKSYLHLLEFDGLIRMFLPGQVAGRRRLIVFMDDPQAPLVVRDALEEGRLPMRPLPGDFEDGGAVV